MAISTCTVTGNVKNLLGSNVADCTVKVSVISPFLYETSLISGQLSTVTTNASGDFSITVIETVTTGQRVNFTFEYYDGVANRRTKTFPVIIPIQASAAFTDLVAVAAVPVSATYPAQGVTVSAIANLTATNAQTAFQEHQADIDAGVAALAAHIAIAAGAHAASAISNTPSGNLVATTAQAALNELQTDIDTGASNLSSHIANVSNPHTVTKTQLSLGNVDNTSDATKNSATATLTNKTLTTPIIASISNTGTLTLPTSSDTLVGRATTDTLTNKTISGASNTITNVSLTSGVTGTLPVANGGTGATTLAENGIVFGNGTSAVGATAVGTSGHVLTSNGVGVPPTFQMASGGQGGINVLTLDATFLGTKTTNSDAETSVGDWVAYADAAGTSPVDMTGGSPNTTIARSTTTPMNGAAHFLMTLTTGASRQGEGVSSTANIPPAYRGKTLALTFPFVTTGVLIEDDLRLFVYDVTNSELITPFSYGGILGGQGMAGATFPVKTNTAQIRVGVHVARTSTAALTLSMDDIKVSPEIPAFGMAGSNWASYTPTFTGFGTVSTQTFNWRRVGNSIEIQGSFTAGTPTATEARISLPPGLVTSSSIGAALQLLNPVSRNVSASTYFGIYTAVEASVAYIVFTAQTSTVNNATKANGNGLVGAGNLVSLVTGGIPISGWDANITMGSANQFRISSYLANGTRVTGSAPTRLGEYRSYRRNAAAITFTETSSAPTFTPTAADGFRLYDDDTFATGAATGSPTRYEIFVGKNKNVSWVAYLSTGRTGTVDTSPYTNGSSFELGSNKHYDPVTGIFSIAAARWSNHANHRGGVSGDGVSTAANPYFDIIVSEDARAVGFAEGKQAVLVGQAYYAATASATWTRTTGSMGDFSTVAAAPSPTIVLNNTAYGTIQTTDNNLPQLTINNLLSGDYEVTVMGTFFGSSAQNFTLRLSDGTTNSPVTYFYPASGIYVPISMTYVVNYASTGNRTFKVQGFPGGGATLSLDNTTSELTFTVRRYF